MIDIALGTIYIAVHLVAHHEAQQVLAHFAGVRFAVESLDNATLFQVGIVAYGNGGHCRGSGIEHLFERGESHKGGIGVLADDDELRHAVGSTGEREDMTVELAAFGKHAEVETEFWRQLLPSRWFRRHRDRC